MKKIYNFKLASWVTMAIVATGLTLIPETAFCARALEDVLRSVEGKLINTALPAIAILGVVWASFSFISGNPNGRNHLIMAGVGAVIGFSAPSIIAFLQGMSQSGLS